MQSRSQKAIIDTPASASILSEADKFALEHLSGLAARCMRSKTILKQLTSLSDRGLIDFMAIDCEATLTDAGRTALAAGAK